MITFVHAPVSSNIFVCDPNILAALSGRGSPNLINSSVLYNVGGTTTIDDNAGLFQQITTGTGNTTLNTTDAGLPGQLLILEFANDAGGARTVTFGANFRPVTSTVVGTASKSILIAFMSNGVNWMELFRTTAIT